MESFQEEKEELNELRNFTYNANRIDIEEEKIKLEDIINELGNKRIILCGGHPNMVRKLKETLPQLEALSTDTLGKDFSYLKGFDVLYFYPNYANHSFYRKIKEAIKNSNTKLVYLQDKDNVNSIILDMKNGLN